VTNYNGYTIQPGTYTVGTSTAKSSGNWLTGEKQTTNIDLVDAKGNHVAQIKNGDETSAGRAGWEQITDPGSLLFK
jgi:hypothetical protein